MSLASHSFFTGNVGSQGLATSFLDYFPHLHTGSAFNGYGKLIPDPNGLLDLPQGFHYKLLSQQGDSMTDGNPVTQSADGVAAYTFRRGRVILIRNHQLPEGSSISYSTSGITPLFDTLYDAHPNATGGTTNLIVGHRGRLINDYISLSGTLSNGAGGTTPWQSWLSCEKETTYLNKPHGYVFEVSPLSNGNPQPIVDMGRFNHESICFDQQGIVYQSEVAKDGYGCFYRYLPISPFGGLGSLHCGGSLQAMSVKGFGAEFSKAHHLGTVLEVTWVDVENPDPKLECGEMSVSEQVINQDASLFYRCDNSWADSQGNIWFVAKTLNPSFRNLKHHYSTQIWKYDPFAQTIELTAILENTELRNPSNVSQSPLGFSLAAVSDDNSQTLLAITEQGNFFPLGKNSNNEDSFAGATFSKDSQTMYVNMSGVEDKTFVITGPWS